MTKGRYLQQWFSMEDLQGIAKNARIEITPAQIDLAIRTYEDGIIENVTDAYRDCIITAMRDHLANPE